MDQSDLYNQCSVEMILNRAVHAAGTKVVLTDGVRFTLLGNRSEFEATFGSHPLPEHIDDVRYDLDAKAADLILSDHDTLEVYRFSDGTPARVTPDAVVVGYGRLVGVISKRDFDSLR